MPFQRIRYFLIGTLALSLISLINFGFDIGKPFPGFLTHYNNSQSQFMLHQSTPKWWLDGDARTLDIQDHLLAVNDIQLTYDAKESTLYREAYERGDRTVKLTVNQMGKPSDLVVPLKLFSFDHFIEFLFPLFITGFGFWLIALVIYQTKIDTLINRTFIFLCLIVAINRMAILTGVFYGDTPFDTIIFLMLRLIEPYLGFQLIRFAFHYPTTIFANNKLIHRLLAVIPILLCLTIFAEHFSVWVLNKPLSPQLSLYTTILFFGSILVGCLAVIFRLLQEGLRGKVKWQRTEALIFLSGMLLALPDVLLFVWGVYFPISNEFLRQVDLRYITLGAPIGFAIATMRYQTFRLGSRLFLLVPAMCIAGIGAGVTTALWRFSLPLFAEPTAAFVYLGTFCLFLFVPLLWIFQSAWNSYFARLLNWESWSYKVLQDFPLSVVAEVPPNKLPDNIVNTFVSLMGLEFASLWLPEDEENGRFNLIAKTALTPVTFPITLFSTREEKLYDPVQIRSPIISSNIPAWLTALLAQEEVEYVIPMRNNDQLVGVLAIGKRTDGGFISSKDVGILTQAAQTSALLLLSEKQTNVVRAFPNQIATAQERERLKIARELHDTIQQFLGRLPFYLETSREQIATQPKEADKLLAQSIQEVEQAAKTVREIRNNLAPQRLELGLIEPIEELTKRFEKRTNTPISLRINNPEYAQKTSLEARHAIYRVIQQALDNIIEHAQATNVKVELNCKVNHMKIAVEDNGVGYKKMNSTNDKASRFGLASMEARIRSLGGEFAPVSIVGKGTRIVGTIPYTYSLGVVKKNPSEQK